MKHIDALRRNHISNLQINPEDWFLTIQLQDEGVRQIVEQLKSKTNRDIEQNYIYKENRLFRLTIEGEKLVIPRNARFQLLQKYDDDIGHPGLVRCSKLINDNFSSLKCLVSYKNALLPA